MRQIFILSLLVTAVFAHPAMAEVTCVLSDGEAAILNNDVPSAKAEAVARAQWGAIEQVVGVDVKAQTVVQNMMMVGDAVSKELNGCVSKYNVIKQESRDGTLTVRINACVEPTRARDAVAGLALNNAISVLILSKNVSPHSSPGYDDANLLSESIIGKLADRGYKVIDIAPTQSVDARIVESAIRSGKFASLRSLVQTFLTNLLLIGKVEYNVSTRKNENIGYGLSMPFNNVTARLTYRLVAKDAKGNLQILSAGVEQGSGLAGSVEDAAAQSLKEVTDKVTPVILEKINRNLKGVAKNVSVKIGGISELRDNFAVKEMLQNTVWVLEVTETGIGAFEVKYSENPVYLANSLEQKGQFKLVDFSDVTMRFDYIRHDSK